MVFLPGSGEASPENNYAALARKMALPQVASLVLLGSHTLPFDLGYAWFQEMDYTTGETLHMASPLRLSSLSLSVSQVVSLVLDLSKSLPMESIFLLGFSSVVRRSQVSAHSTS